jgi:CarD family transcriptional regulator
MEKIGTIVSVGTKGICKIIDIKEDAFEGAEKDRLYYIMEPVESSNNMQIYMPVDAMVHIRKLVSKSEAKSIIENFYSIEDVAVSAETERLKIYETMAKSGNISDWARLLKTLMQRKEKLSRKQISGLEQKMFVSVQNNVLAELSTVLEKSREEIEEKLVL